MSLNLVGFVKSLLPSFSKSDVETDMEISLETIPVILEVYGNLEEVTKVTKLQNKANKTLIDNFYKELDIKGSKVKLSRSKNLGQDIVTLINNAKLNGDYILKEISDSVNDTIMAQALTAYKINLLRVVPHFYFLTRYCLDMVNYIYEKEMESTDTDKSYKLNKKQEEFVTKNVWVFAKIISFYGSDHEEFKRQVDALSEVTVPRDSVDDVVSQLTDDKLDLFNSLPSGFVGSPIYSVRLVFAQWEADRYRSMKDKKKLLELRLLHLKLIKEQGTTDANVEREITYLQKAVTDYDYKLSKIESSVEDV